jgi:transcriptional regulator with XRE-family HTH domain
MPLRPERFEGLRNAKGLSQGDLAHLAGIGQSTITKLECGNARNIGADILERIALALDATTDFFFGRGFEEVDTSVAAVHMSYDVFARDPKVTVEQRERCRRVLSHKDAPKTAGGWRSLAEMLDLAVGPTSTTSSREPKLALIRERAIPKCKR